MLSLGRDNHDETVRRELNWCFTFEPDSRAMCHGASGRKLRQLCIYCPNLIRDERKEEQENEKGD